MTAITFFQGRIAPVAVLVVAATIAAVFAPATAHAQPELIEVAPVEGASLSELPEFFHLCFSEAVKIEPTKEWGFSLRPPDGSGVGLRTVFGTDATCVDVYPGVLAEPPPGIWSLSWLVHAQSDGSEGSGELRYQIGDLQPGDTPLATRKISTAGGDGVDVLTAPVVLIGVGVFLVWMAFLWLFYQWGAGIAEKKGRSRSMGGWIAVLFGFIGILILHLMPDDPAPRQ